VAVELDENEPFLIGASSTPCWPWGSDGADDDADIPGLAPRRTSCVRSSRTDVPS